jgi:tetratricopeptide (TPR) repeat protein
VHVRLGEQETAHRYFTQALDLFSKQGNAAAVARIYSDAQTNLLRVSLPVRLLQRVASACEDAQQYELARQALANLCRDFTYTTDAELGMLKLGKLHLQKLGQRDNALAIFAEFLRLYPTSEWANHVRGLITENQNAS